MGFEFTIPMHMLMSMPMGFEFLFAEGEAAPALRVTQQKTGAKTRVKTVFSQNKK